MPDCYNEASSSPSCSSYTITVDKNGGISGTPSASSYIGYESTAVIERVCIPSSAVLSDAFKDVVNNITTTLQAGQFATLVQDVKNVNNILIIELAMAFGWSRICDCNFITFHVLTEMLSRLHCLDFNFGINFRFRWFGNHFPI